MLRQEKGITLVALIITIIILVILAAVSIAAVYNSGIVNYAVNGAVDYANEAARENNIINSTESLLESTITVISSIMNGAS